MEVSCPLACGKWGLPQDELVHTAEEQLLLVWWPQEVLRSHVFLLLPCVLWELP